jgi:hypothetical protein
MAKLRPGKCAICGMMHGGAKDHEHSTHHHKYLACCLRLGYYPPHGAIREKQKKLGHKLVNNENADLNDRVYGALLVVQAWFDRSLDQAITNETWSKHPHFEHFAAMIKADLFPDDVQKVLSRRFNKPGKGKLNGSNYWSPA